MKLTLFLLLACTMSLLADDTYSQSKKLNLHLQGATIKEALTRIEDQSEFYFMYSGRVIDVEREVSVNIEDQKINNVLDQLFAGTDVNYTISDRIIVLTTPEIFRTGSRFSLQQHSVTGTVTDPEGNPLPGVNIVEVGTTNGAVTDLDGNYSITVSSEDAVLSFSFVGYLTEQIEVGGQTNINVTLVEDIQALDEVVVIGYGTVKKSDLTGSVSSVRAEEFSSQPVLSVDHAMQGRVSGVQVTQADGAPGSGISIRIRGGNSLRAGNEPLYVIDGFPIYSDNSEYSAGDYYDFPVSQNAMASLNPGDIESIEILKDASATAIYGSRGANGVVLITTKRGRAGKTNVQFETYYGLQTISKKLDVLTGPQYLDYLNDAYTNAGLEPPDLSSAAGELAENVDMQNEIFRTAPLQNYQLTVSGGNQKTTFATVANYQKEDGIIYNSDFTRLSLRVNLDHNISEKIKFGNSFSASNTVNNQAPTGGAVAVVNSALEWIPVVPIRYEDGSYVPSDWEYVPWSGGNHNPVQRMNLEHNLLDNKRLLDNFYVEWYITPELRLKSTAGIDYTYSKREYLQPLEMARSENVGGIAKLFHGSILSFLNENTLDYSITIDKHDISLLAGFTQQTYINELASLDSRQFITDVLGVWDIGAGSNQTHTSNKKRWDLLSWIGRANYTFNDKYLLTASIRADGSSRFSEENKWGIFPSAAFAWRLSEEQFIKDLGVFSTFKFRASYGITGNAEIGTYQSVQRLVSGQKDVNDVVYTTYYSEGLPVPDLRWEQTAQFDIGLDFGFFDNRLSFTADFYQKTTEDLLVQIPLPPASGIGSILKNIGSLKNQGIELSTQAVIFDGAFGWDINANISFNQNEVTDLGGIDEYYLGAASWFTNYNLVRVGEPIGNFYGLIYDGVYQEGDDLLGGAQPGDPKYRDISGPDGTPDDVINNLDNTIIGNALPDFHYGFTNVFSYKNVDLNIFCQGVSGNDMLNINNSRGFTMTGNSNDLAEVLNRWTPTNTDTDIPRANANATREVMSSRIIEDASFFRVKTVTLGYNFKANSMSWFNGGKVYVTANNLFTVTDYSAYDPEVNMHGQNNNLNMGVDWGVYPRAKSFILGLRLNF